VVMDWIYTLILYLGLFDGAIVMLGGLATAFVILMAWDASAFWERIWPATLTLVGTNVAAAIILYVVARIVH
jgi:hypothetical protein